MTLFNLSTSISMLMTRSAQIWGWQRRRHPIGLPKSVRQCQRSWLFYRNMWSLWQTDFATPISATSPVAKAAVVSCFWIWSWPFGGAVWNGFRTKSGMTSGGMDPPILFRLFSLLAFALYPRCYLAMQVFRLWCSNYNNFSGVDAANANSKVYFLGKGWHGLQRA